MTIPELISKMREENAANYADLLQEAWSELRSRRLTCAECGDTCSIEDLDEEGICNYCRASGIVEESCVS